MVSEYLQREVRDRMAIASDLARTPGRSWRAISTIADGLDVMFAVTHFDPNVGAPVFAHVSQHARALTGYWPSELVGQDPRILQDGSDGRVAQKFMRHLMTNGEAEMRLRNVRKNGEAYGCHIVALKPEMDKSVGYPDFYAFLTECRLSDCT